eukprot:8403745-Pyramimonas_sp.AAC.1
MAQGWGNSQRALQRAGTGRADALILKVELCDGPVLLEPRSQDGDALPTRKGDLFPSATRGPNKRARQAVHTGGLN